MAYDTVPASNDTYYAGATTVVVTADCPSPLGGHAWLPSTVVAYERRNARSYGKVEQILTGRSCGTSVDHGTPLTIQPDEWTNPVPAVWRGEPSLVQLGAQGSGAPLRGWVALVGLVGPLDWDPPSNVAIAISRDGGATWAEAHLLGEGPSGGQQAGMKTEYAAATHSWYTFYDGNYGVYTTWNAGGRQWLRTVFVHANGAYQAFPAQELPPAWTSMVKARPSIVGVENNSLTGFEALAIVYPEARNPEHCTTGLKLSDISQRWHALLLGSFVPSTGLVVGPVWHEAPAGPAEPSWKTCLGDEPHSALFFRNEERAPAAFVAMPNGSGGSTQSYLLYAATRRRKNDPTQMAISLEGWRLDSAIDPFPTTQPQPFGESSADGAFPEDHWNPSLASESIPDGGASPWVHVSWTGTRDSTPQTDEWPSGIYGQIFSFNPTGWWTGSSDRIQQIDPALLNGAGLPADAFYDLGSGNAAASYDPSVHRFVSAFSDGRFTPPGGVYSVQVSP